MTPFDPNLFAPGNMAIIIKCGECPELLMKMVRLEACIPLNDELFIQGILFTNRGSPHEPAWVVSGKNLLRRRGLTQIVPSAISCLTQSWLMPIKPDALPVPEQETEHEES